MVKTETLELRFKLILWKITGDIGVSYWTEVNFTTRKVND